MKLINKLSITKLKIERKRIDIDFKYYNKRQYFWLKKQEYLIEKHLFSEQKYLLNDFIRIFKDKYFDKKTLLVFYKPYIKFYLNDNSIEIKYFETSEELDAFYNLELSELKLLEV